jgi:4-amino-4-deoxy-L-arabinose transferase-like glycosyltransferase
VKRSLPFLLAAALVLLLRLPFLDQAIQGDDYYYLAGAQHAQIDPAHPNHARYLFQGEMVDMRGHPHPPLNSWTLAALLALLGDIREVPFHAAYIVFSLIAALSMAALAVRFSERPAAAVAIFCLTPAFVVNGNSLESDVPFLAFWLAAIALFTQGRIALSMIASAAAALFAYQAVLLVPVLGLYLWLNKEKRAMAWLAIFTAPLVIVLWQLWERAASGAFPAAVLAGYLGPLQILTQKLRSAAALTGHVAWIAFPALAWLVARGAPRWLWAAAAIAGLGGAMLDPHPLFWVSFGTGVLILGQAACRLHKPEERFLNAWILIFFAASLALFFAGSARYLLPLAAPLAIVIANRVRAKWIYLACAAQAVLSLGLAAVNYQHWDGYRNFAAGLAPRIASQRTWVTGEWGLRHYLESEGALPLPNGRALQGGEILVSSELALSRTPTLHGGAVRLAQREIGSAIPLRIISLGGRSAYSTAAGGLRPFDISTAIIDRVTADQIVQRKPELSLLDLSQPEARAQVVSGIFPDGWMGSEALVALKAPPRPAKLRTSFYLPPFAEGDRSVSLLVDGVVVARGEIRAPGLHSVETSGEIAPARDSVSVTLRVSRTFRVEPDTRDLGLLVREIGFGR